MDDNGTINAILVGARAVHFGACLLIFGVLLLDRLVIIEDADDDWRGIARWLVLLSLATALLSGAAWFALNAITMSGLAPAEALRPEVLRIVLDQTHFGTLWKLRLVCWLAATVATLIMLVLRKKTTIWLATAASAALAGSLAWAGHGQTGPMPSLHLAADVIHLLTSGIWPVGLLPFGCLLWRLRRSSQPEARRTIVALTARFSAAAVVCVMLLAASGVVNSWLLVGSWGALGGTFYGKVLLLKIFLFGSMVLIGAVNLIHLRPRLRMHDLAPSALLRLQRNVWRELLLLTIVLVIVGLLGLLVPPVEGMPHEHHIATVTVFTSV